MFKPRLQPYLTKDSTRNKTKRVTLSLLFGGKKPTASLRANLLLLIHQSTCKHWTVHDANNI